MANRAIGTAQNVGRKAGSTALKQTISTPAGSAPVLPLLLMGIGGYLLWFGVHYYRDQGVKWPSDPIKDVLQGKGLPAANQATTTSAELTSDFTSGSTSSGSGSGGGGQPTGTGSGGTSAQNIALGQMMAASVGWTGNNWLCLKTGWQEESGWSTTAAYDKADPYNSAYGIPQSNPGTKMASAGSDWKTSAKTQIKWGIDYIRSTYGSPSQVPHWSPNGPTSGYVGY